MYNNEAIVVLAVLFLYMFLPLMKRVFRHFKERYEQARLEELKRKLAAMQQQEKAGLHVAPLSACKPHRLRKVQHVRESTNSWQDNLNSAGMVQAVVLSEVLGPPRAHNPFFSRKFK